MKTKKGLKKKNKSLRGLLVRGYLEGVTYELFELIENKLQELLRGHSGIYVLYKNDNIYYIGLAKSLHGRIKDHLKDRHQNRWNKFSLYVVKRTTFLRDIESLMVRLVKPKGNQLVGQFRKEGNLKPKIKDELNGLQKALNRARK
jgi:hypothetical protein